MQEAAVFSDSDELVVAEPAEPGGIAKPTAKIAVATASAIPR